MWNHPDAVFGTQRNGCEDFDGMSRDNFEMKLLLNHSQQQRSFHHRKGRANTDAWPAAEGKVRETRNFSRANRVVPPPFRVESVLVRKETCIALRAPLQNEHVCPRRYPVAPKLAIFQSSPADAPYRGVEPHRFFEDHLRITQSGKVF